MNINNFRLGWFKRDWWGYKRRRKPVPLEETHFEDGLSGVDVLEPGTSEVIVHDAQNAVELVADGTEAPSLWVDVGLTGAHVEADIEVLEGDSVIIVLNDGTEYPATVNEDGIAEVVLGLGYNDPLLGVTIEPDSTSVTLGAITVKPRLF